MKVWQAWVDMAEDVWQDRAPESISLYGYTEMFYN